MQKSPALESQSSYEHERIRQLVEKEGKSARNLVTWSVPAAEEARSARGKPGARRRARPGARGSEQLSRSERMCVAAAGKYSNPARGGKASGRPANKADVHARYWSYLFDNLFRAVDEVYKTCEVDCSVVECQVQCTGSLGSAVCMACMLLALQEVMMTLQACHRDFEALIHRIELERQLETGSQQRSECSPGCSTAQCTVCMSEMSRCVSQALRGGVGDPQDNLSLQAEQAAHSGTPAQRRAGQINSANSGHGQPQLVVG